MESQEQTILIKRACLWFSTGQEITFEKFKEYYTDKALESLWDFDYIEINTKNKAT